MVDAIEHAAYCDGQREEDDDGFFFDNSRPEYDSDCDGDIVEVFACGTAAVITPVGQFLSKNETLGQENAEPGALTSSLREELNQVPGVRGSRAWGIPAPEVRVAIDSGRIERGDIGHAVDGFAQQAGGATGCEIQASQQFGAARIGGFVHLPDHRRMRVGEIGARQLAQRRGKKIADLLKRGGAAAAEALAEAESVTE